MRRYAEGDGEGRGFAPHTDIFTITITAAGWVAITVTGGVIGNAAYDGLKTIAGRARRRTRSHRTDPQAPGAETQPIARPRPITEAEVLRLARATIEAAASPSRSAPPASPRSTTGTAGGF